MIIELKKLVNKSLDITRELQMGAERQPIDDVHYEGPVDVDFFLESEEDVFTLSGSFTAHIVLVCDRCLNRYKETVSEEVILKFIPMSALAVEEEIELNRADLDVSTYEDSIDLCKIVDEQVALALPMKFLCTDDCAGLCPHCGTNLNESDCDCEDTRIDDRWQGLLEIKKKLTGGEEPDPDKE